MAKSQINRKGKYYHCKIRVCTTSSC